MGLNTKVAVLCMVSAFCLAGCERESVSYGITSRNHSMTLIIEKPYFWSKQYTQNVIVANMPECQRRYRLQTVDIKRPYRVKIYDYGTYSHLWIVHNQYYLFDHFNCTFEMLKNPVEPPSSKEAFIGEFYIDKAGHLKFQNARRERILQEKAQLNAAQELPERAPVQQSAETQLDQPAQSFNMDEQHKDIMPY